MANETLIQYFHWYSSNDGNFWKEAGTQAQKLKELGITTAWLPPACKGREGVNSNGYDCYDLFDIGEFDQKETVRTKFGTRDEYTSTVNMLQQAGIAVYADIVLNHKGGADELEKVRVRRVSPDNRNEFISDQLIIDAYTKFTFPGRKGKYSDFIWDLHCFSGVDYAADLKETAIFSIVNEYGSDWEEIVDSEKGNYDYLMFADIDFRNPFVREELKRWGKWFMETTAIDGVRLDAVKHMSPKFINEWLDYMRTIKPGLRAVGEYWAPGDLPLLLKYMEATGDRMSLFDATLHNNFYAASKAGRDYDLRSIFKDCLLTVKPALTVTLVDNHDTQPLQEMESPVEQWFKPLAYALILLREAGLPCVFYPDLYGAQYTGKGQDGKDCSITMNKCNGIEQLLRARKQYAYGLQRDYFDHGNCIGWTRTGEKELPGSGCAVILSNSDAGFKNMEMGKEHAGKIFTDCLGNHPGQATINESGWGVFEVPAGSVAVWVEK